MSVRNIISTWRALFVAIGLCAAQASAGILFHADFEGGRQQPASSDVLNTGTAIGSWTAYDVLASKIIPDNGIGEKQAVIFNAVNDNEVYDFIARPIRPATLSNDEPALFSFDVSVRRNLSSGDRVNHVVGLDAHGNEVFRLHVDAVPVNRLRAIHANDSYTVIGSLQHLQSDDVYDPAKLRTVTLVLRQNSMDIHFQGSLQQSGMVYRTPGVTHVAAIHFYGDQHYTGAQYKNIILQQGGSLTAFHQPADSDWMGTPAAS